MTNIPYSLSTDAIKVHRMSLLNKKHISPLTDFVHRMRTQTSKGEKIPFFDPLDGGQNAEVLFLLEAPGPAAVKSGFISRNNPDPTAKNFCELNTSVGLNREKTISWNIVPWYIGIKNNIRPANNADITQGKPWLKELLRLLKKVKFIVLVGKKSQSIHVWLSAETSAHIFALHHSSNRVKNSYPQKFRENRSVLLNIKNNL